MTTTTTNLKLAVRKLDRPEIITFACVLIFVVAIAVAVVGHHLPAPAVAVAPTPALVILIATATIPTSISVASANANVLPRAVVAYASPDGLVIGAVEAGRHYGFLARSGDGWLQLAIDGSGAVWVRSADLIGAPDLANVATPTSGPRVVVVSGSAYDDDAPAATMEPRYNTQDPSWYTTVATPEPAFVQAVIGADPNALACNGSPLCGGLTNAQAAAIERQRAQGAP